MNNKAHDLKKIIAFTASILMVSHSFAAMPISESTQIMTAHAEQEAKTSAPSVKNGNTVKDEPVAAATTAAVTTAAATTAETSAETTTVTAAAAEEVEYTVSVTNYELYGWELRDLAKEVFNGIEPEGNVINGKVKIKVTEGTVPKEEAAVSNKKFRLVSSGTNELRYEAYCKLEKSIGDFAVSIAESDAFPGDENYLKVGSEVTLATKELYIFADHPQSGGTAYSTEKKFTVKGETRIDYRAGGYPSLSVRSGNEYTDFEVHDRSFKVGNIVGCKLRVNGEEKYSGDELFWKDLDSMTLETRDKQVVTVIAGDERKRYDVEDMAFWKGITLSKLKDEEDIRYKQDEVISFSAVDSSVDVNICYEGSSDAVCTFSADVYAKKTNGVTKDYFDVPYLYNSNYCLVKYRYGSDVEVTDALSKLENGVYNATVEYSGEYSQITLEYRKIPGGSGFDYAQTTDVYKRNKNCYTITKNNEIPRLIDFSAEYYDQTVLYDELTGDNKLKTNSLPLSSNKHYLFFGDSRYKYVFVKNLLSEDTANFEDSICFYNDNKAPELTIRSKQEDWRSNLTGSTYRFTVTDYDEPDINRDGPLSYEQQEILRVYDDYINKESDNKEEIASIIVGDYRFDKGSDGWSGTVEGRYEPEAVRTAKKKAVEELKSGFSEYTKDTSDAYFISELENGGKGIRDSISSKYDDKLKAAETEEEETDIIKEQADTIADADKVINDYTAAVTKAAKDAADAKYYPTLTFNSDKSFTVVIKAKKAGTAVDIKDLPVFAVDNGDNRSAVKKIDVRIDGSAPVIDKDSVKIKQGGDELTGDEIVLKGGCTVSVDVSDTGSGVRDVYCYLDGRENDIGGESRKRMEGYGTYRYDIRSEDVASENSDHSRDGKARLSFIAYDNVGNTSGGDDSTLISGRTVIVDTTAPECSISDSSANRFEQDADGRKRNWYHDYSDISLPIKAYDKNPEICSGLKNITLTLNPNNESSDRAVTLDVVTGDGTDAACVYSEPLSDGRYYIAFEGTGDNGGFNAYLMRSDDANVKIPVFENCSRGGSGNGNNTSEGSIRVKIEAEDRADLKNSTSGEFTTEAEVFVDLNDPEVASIEAYNSDIYRKNTDIDGDKVRRFGHFSNSSYEAVIRIDDFGPSAGISRIKVDLYNADGSLYREDHPVRRDGNNNVWFISVPIDFKGEMMAVAYDNVGRASAAAKTIGFITESVARHDNTSSMSVVLPETEFRDRNGLPLYSEESVTARITVKDSFSEIRDVITNAPGSDEKRIHIDGNGNISGDDADSWRITKGDNDRNLVPDITRDMIISENSNGNKISVSMTDNAGNPDELKVEEREFSIDSTDPKLNVTFVDSSGSADSKYGTIFKHSRRAVITVTERNFDSARVDVKLNGKAQELTWTHSGGTEGTDDAQYSAEINIEADGVYRLTASCTDMGNRASGTFDSGQFTIDRTEPALKVGFDQKIENGSFYKDSVVAQFSVSDNNFDPERIKVTGTYNNKTEGFPAISAWVQKGDSYVATIKFDKDGEYHVNITGTDKAGNAVSPYSGTFNVDKNSPEIKLIDVKPANNGDEIKPKIVFNDPNINKDSIKITLEGANRGKDLDFDGTLEETDKGYEYIFDNIPEKEAYDDIYTIRATAKDKAENRTDETFRFSVNRFGSTFMFDDNTQAIAGQYVSKPHDVVITEYNADKISGGYSVFITKDGEMRELEDNKEYSVKVSGGDTTWTEYEYTIPASIFEEDGRYTVSIHSTDEAGNINISASSKKKAELDFCVDKTEPLCIPLNITDNGAYKGDNHKARLSVSDNIMLKDAEVFIDGHLIDSEFSGDECVFDIPNSKHTQSIKVVLTDMADNKIEYLYKNILVTTSAARLMAHRTWFKVVCGAAAVAAGAAALFIRRRKSRLR